MWLWVINATLIYYFFLSFWACFCFLMNSSSKNVERTHFKCSFYDHDEIFAHKNQQLQGQQQQPEKGATAMKERFWLLLLFLLFPPSSIHLGGGKQRQEWCINTWSRKTHKMLSSPPIRHDGRLTGWLTSWGYECLGKRWWRQQPHNLTKLAMGQAMLMKISYSNS